MKTLIVAFAFGVPQKIRSNRLIGSIATEEAKRHEASILTQADINIAANVADVVYVPEDPGQPPPTLRIARAAIAEAKKRNATIIIIVAAEPHWWRCRRDMIAAAKEKNFNGRIIISAMTKHHSDEWFCPDSTQSRTRSLGAWNGRERILKILPLFLYKMVAS